LCAAHGASPLGFCYFQKAAVDADDFDAAACGEVRRRLVARRRQRPAGPPAGVRPGDGAERGAAPGRPAGRIYVSCGIYESLIYENRSLVPLLIQLVERQTLSPAEREKIRRLLDEPAPEQPGEEETKP